MYNLERKLLQTKRGMLYTYWASAPEGRGVNEDTAIVLLHGFRDTSLCWQFVIPHLLKLPYRIIALDLLGHGGSSKPTDPSLYAYHLMAQDVLDIVNHENVRNIIPVGHDHGAGLATRIYNHHPDRVSALVTLNVAYSVPNKSTPFNLAAVNAASKANFGYPIYEYWHFLTAPDAARVMSDNLDRVWDIPHANSFDEMKALYCVPNAWREYLTDPNRIRINVKPYARNSALREAWKADFGKCGFEAPLCWYTAILQQVQLESDKTIEDENVRIRVPYLFIGCDGDAPCRPEAIQSAIRSGKILDCTERCLKGVGHWPMYEQPEEMARLIECFLQSKLSM